MPDARLQKTREAYRKESLVSSLLTAAKAAEPPIGDVVRIRLNPPILLCPETPTADDTNV